jgi:effector-binding domain-containing protein
MKKKHPLLFALPYLFVLIFLAACGNNSSEKKETPQTKEEKKDTAVKEKKTETTAKRAPIINIMDTVSVKRTVIYMKDSAATYERIGMKLGEIYGFKLAAVIKKTGMKVTGRPMSWHNTQKAPYYFEAGVPVEKKMGKLPSNVYVREMGTDSVTIARFYGPYDLLPQAYDALKDIMKGRKKKAKEKIYEIYVDDPLDKDGKMKDPYKVQTDVVFTWK